MRNAIGMLVLVAMGIVVGIVSAAESAPYGTPPTGLYGGGDFVSRTYGAEEERAGRKDALSKILAQLTNRKVPNRDHLESQAELHKAAILRGYYGGEVISRSGTGHLSGYNMTVGQTGILARCEIAQIAGPQEMHVIITGLKRVILRGYPTAGLADGQRLALSQSWKVTGTESYETVTGASATVFVLEPYASVATKVAISPQRSFPWRDQDGRILVTGEFLRLDTGRAVFQTDEGEKNVPLTKLSTGDRQVIQWLRKLEE